MANQGGPSFSSALKFGVSTPRPAQATSNPIGASGAEGLAAMDARLENLEQDSLSNMLYLIKDFIVVICVCIF